MISEIDFYVKYYIERLFFFMKFISLKTPHIYTGCFKSKCIRVYLLSSGGSTHTPWMVGDTGLPYQSEHQESNLATISIYRLLMWLHPATFIPICTAVVRCFPLWYQNPPRNSTQGRLPCSLLSIFSSVIITVLRLLRLVLIAITRT